MKSADDDLLDEETLDSAIRWLVRVQSDAATADDWAELAVWLEQSAANQAAFDKIEMLSAEIDEAKSSIHLALPPVTAEILPFPVRRPKTVPRRWEQGRGAIAAGVVGLSVLTSLGVWRAADGPLQVYKTGVGETREIALADGSHVRLDAASTLKVRLGWFARKVEMGEAEATFDVAKNAHKPFEIAVADQKVRVVGTEFNIRNYDGRVNVTVRRGIVAVYQGGFNTPPIARLTPGWSIQHTVGSIGSVQSQVDPNRAFAWTQGRLICDGQPLSEIVAYLNRRYAQPIRIPQTVASRRFTGVLQLDDQQDVVRRLAAYLSLSIHGSSGDIVLS